MTPVTTDEKDTRGITSTIAGIESWLDTMHGGHGYGGPAVGFHNVSLSYCGPAFDWRCEGILDGCVAMYRATGDPAYLDRLARDLGDIAKAQLANGAFKNSYFEFNPFEGGMPHEPAVLAAAYRAMTCLKEASRPMPDGIEQAIAFYIEHRLLRELWNKLLHTFNDWETSDFTDYVPCSVAAALELLALHANYTGEWASVERYVLGAAESLVAAQVQDGPLAGALPLSKRAHHSANLYLTARCLPALVTAHARTQDARYRAAAERLNAFVERHTRSGETQPRMLFAQRPPSTWPLFPGACAGTLFARLRSGFVTREQATQEALQLIAYALPTGAFRTAVGSGALSGQSATPDWRDVLPVCGWTAKVYALLAELHPSQRGAFAAASFESPIRTAHGRAVLKEDATSLRIESERGTLLYHWVKGERWPRSCTL